ncbi:MAG: ATP synthase gamma chain [Candidatus Daviesbacteria bacterium GW2011_GWA2_38_24]|uniref:ATP synthase gamma chain n=1 Tax=Candidatus Daviesbacteria bacterium GW2011_GWA2_38_24 TaxID=1618422 RepID=A0A0G0MP94_9BACT|nr:MAG: ATP synthase gamma chain [Candidatus Daviesbacteria bacterium GW2011_GWA2_38_24]OGE23049.1 MAG: hypothetical protein A2688_03580 [Candidatus Daviesbacteria bacterium RIFCSPHIGHO2_01_FULL_38_8]
MSTIQNLKSQIEDTEAIKLVAQALEEISAVQIRATRDLVKQNIAFFGEITNVYHAVKVVALRHKLLGEKTPLLEKNGKTISVLLTSNEHFYGGLDQELTQLFVEKTTTYPTDRLVIGKYGTNYLKNTAFPEPFDPIIIGKDFPTPEELKQIVDKTYPYSKVLFYHSKFVTVLKQENEISDISGANVEQQAGSGEFDYILEPDIDKMLYFFENQILTLLFKAIFLESRLSRTSARMVSMYSAENNADNVLRHQRLQLSKTLRSIQNKAILESFSANLSINKSSTNEGEMYENIIKGLNVFGR